MIIEQQLARLAGDINRATFTRDVQALGRAPVPRLEAVERRVQPVARLLTAKLGQRLADRARLGDLPPVERDEDQIVRALEVIVERLFADSRFGEAPVKADLLEAVAAH